MGYKGGEERGVMAGISPWPWPWLRYPTSASGSGYAGQLREKDMGGPHVQVTVGKKKTPLKQQATGAQNFPRNTFCKKINNKKHNET